MVTYSYPDAETTYGPIGVVESWYVIGTGENIWYGQTFTATAPLKTISLMLRNTTGSNKPLSFEIRKGLGVDAPLAYSNTVSIPNTTTNGLYIDIAIPSLPAGKYHIRLLATTSILVGRNTGNTTESALIATTANPYNTSTYDLLYKLTMLSVFTPEDYFGNDEGTSNRSISTSNKTYYGMEFTTDVPISAIHINGYGGKTVQIRLNVYRGFGQDAVLIFESDPVFTPVNGWYAFELPSDLPPGDYQYRAYAALGQVGVRSRTGFNSAKSITGTMDGTVQSRTPYEFLYRLVRSKRASIPKKWDGSSWVNASVKKWTGSAWITASTNKFMLPPKRFWDVAPILASIDAGVAISAIPEAQEMLTAYGFTTSHYSSAGVVVSGYSTESVDPNDPYTKRAYRLIFDEIAKYPAEFIYSTGLEFIRLTKNLTNASNPTFDIGGTAVDGKIWLDIDSFLWPDNAYDSGYNGLQLILHHELHHMMKTTWSSDFDINAEVLWTNNNTRAYTGTGWTSLPPTQRPQGFIRPYGTMNYTEDMADIFGVLMSSGSQTMLNEILAVDPIVQAKVKIIVDWMRTKHPAFTKEYYFEAIHSI